MDVSDRGSVEGAVLEAVESSGPPDLLLTCAGTAYPDYFGNISDEAYRSMMDTNLTGTWNTLQAVVPLMRRGASIVTVSSVEGFVGTFGYTAYAATKFAVIGLSQALRSELKPLGIRVSVLCPPDTDTPQLIQEDLSKPPETRAVSGNVKVMKPEEVARALLAGLKKNRFLIIPGAASKLVYAVNAVFPALVRAMMDADIRRVQKKILTTEGHE
jgi:NAD(P)-dependent dehydrogenase (short-subunit alcohol dehydrogenase family)